MLLLVVHSSGKSCKTRGFNASASYFSQQSNSVVIERRLQQLKIPFFQCENEVLKLEFCLSVSCFFLNDMDSDKAYWFFLLDKMA